MDAFIINNIYQYLIILFSFFNTKKLGFNLLKIHGYDSIKEVIDTVTYNLKLIKSFSFLLFQNETALPKRVGFY